MPNSMHVHRDGLVGVASEVAAWGVCVGGGGLYTSYQGLSIHTGFILFRGRS